MIRAREYSIRRIGLTLLAAVVTIAAPVRASDVWVAPTYQQDVGGVGIASNVVWPVTAAGVARFAWAVPGDLQTFNSAKVVVIPNAPGGAAVLNVFVCPAANNGAVAAGCVGPFQQAFTGVPNQLAEVEIGGLLATHVGTPGSTYLAVLAYTTPTTSTDHIVGLKFSYTAAIPGNTATLASNTFTGTQAAPLFSGSFAGNGSGLTSLPFPAGAATLGANTFTGTQTATAFVGDGSGLTHLPPGPPGPPGTTGQGVALNFNSTGAAFLTAGENVFASTTLSGGTDVFYSVSFGASFGNVNGGNCTVELYVTVNPSTVSRSAESLVTLPQPVAGISDGWASAAGNLVIPGTGSSQQVKLAAVPTGCASAVWEFPYINILTLKK